VEKITADNECLRQMHENRRIEKDIGMELQSVMSIAMEAGEILLRNGAETYRVEESITKICNGFGFSCESIVLPTGIFLTVRSPQDETETSVRRIKVRTLDLTKIDRINTFSRALAAHPVSPEEAFRQLEAIKATRKYPAWLRFICASTVTFAYALLFGGSLKDALSVLGIGAVVHLLNLTMVRSGYLPFLNNFAVGFVCSFLSLLSPLVVSGTQVYIMIISSVMLYLPGMAMTNGVRDLLAGDLVSGLTRLGEAVLTVLAIGLGAGLAISVVPRLV